ncbi:hypothetical protein ACFE04_017462 [Oxalis oulophora]
MTSLLQVYDNNNNNFMSENDLLAQSKLRNNYQDNSAGIYLRDRSKVFGQTSILEDDHIEVSFGLNLFPNGFSVGSASEVLCCVPMELLPYNKEAKILFNAIENGCLPGDMFDELPCKFVNGTILCEIRDYRNCFVHRTGSISLESSPIVHKVLLKLCIGNVLKDIVLTADSSWTYTDILDAESRILRALQPNLNLDPKPLINQFSGDRKTKKLNLGIFLGRKRRKLTDAYQMQQDFSYSNQISKLQYYYSINQARGSSSVQQIFSSSIPNPKENNDALQIKEVSAQVNPHFALQRLMKIEEVSARHRMNETKIRMDVMFPRKRFPKTPLVNRNLFSFTDHGSLEDPITHPLDVLKMRTITFISSSFAPKGNVSSKISSVGEIKLLILEKLNEGIIQAGVMYVNKHEPDIVGFTSQQVFPGIVCSLINSAEVFASQFTSLITREGYYIANDQTEALELNPGGSSSLPCQQLTGTAQQPSVNLHQLQLLSSTTPNILVGGPPNNEQLPPTPTTFQPVLQLVDSHFAIHTDSHWQQHILNTHAQTQLHMLQRQRHRKELMKMKSVGGHTHHQNLGLEHSLIMPHLKFPWIDNVGRGIIYPSQRNVGMIRMQQPTIPDITYLLNNQQQLRAQMQTVMSKQSEKSSLI